MSSSASRAAARSADARAAIERDVAEGGSVRDRDARLMSKSDGPVDCLVSAETIGVQGAPCILWVYQDVTERRRSEAELADAIDEVMKDASWLSRSILDKLATLRTPAASAPPPPQTDLSRREREVLELIALGQDDRAIAERLGISERTVKAHVSNLFDKHGVRNRTELVSQVHR